MLYISRFQIQFLGRIRLFHDWIVRQFLLKAVDCIFRKPFLYKPISMKDKVSLWCFRAAFPLPASVSAKTIHANGTPSSESHSSSIKTMTCEIAILTEWNSVSDSETYRECSGLCRFQLYSTIWLPLFSKTCKHAFVHVVNVSWYDLQDMLYLKQSGRW